MATQPLLSSLWYYDELYHNTTQVKRVNNIDFLCHGNDKNCDNALPICHLSAILPFTQGDFVPQEPAFEETVAIALAIQHLNTGNGSLVPQVDGLPDRCPIRFTVEAADTEFQGGVALARVVDQTSRKGPNERLPCAFLGAYRSAVSIPMSIVTGLLGYPQVSASSTSADLDDTSQYPLFGRTVPSDEGTTVPIIIYLRNTLQVKHLAIINVNDAFGNNYVEGMRRAAEQHAPDMIIHQITMDDGKGGIGNVVENLVSTQFRFVFCIVFTQETHDELLTEAYQQGVAGTGLHNWLFADSFNGILDNRLLEKGSPLHLSYRGSTVLQVSGGVPSVPAYDKLALQIAELKNSASDREIIGSVFPEHDELNYQGSRPIGEPPFIGDPSFLSPIKTAFVSFMYEATIALGLSACDAYAVNTEFTGADHFDHFTKTTFDGISGSVVFTTTGTRDPGSVLYKVTNYIERETADGKIEYVSVLTDLFQDGNWQTRQKVTFNDGSTNLPADLPPVTVDKQPRVALIVGGLAAAFLLVILFLIRNKRKDRYSDWQVEEKELMFGNPPQVIGRGNFGVVLLAEYHGTHVAVKRILPPSSDENGPAEVFVREHGASMLKRAKQEFLKEASLMSKMRHPCVATIIGAVTGTDPMIIMEYMEHGCLHDMLHNETIPIEGDLILPILCDIAQGVRFLHGATPPVIHGNLKSHNVYVDAKFRAKVADFGLSHKASVAATGNPLWMAPELLRQESLCSFATDTYSFGIILFEVYSRRDPYEDEDPKEVIQLVADPLVQKRPPVPASMCDKIKSLMADCVEEDAGIRPSFEELDMRLKRIDAEDAAPKNFTTRKKPSVSLFDIFPKHIAEALRDGRAIEAEHRDQVTIYFSDIVSFTTISSQMDPRKVADLLDRLYTKFDQLSQKHDIFKVETIGDAYMCVSNLVKDQANDHAKRIAEFAMEAIIAANETLVDPDQPEKGYVCLRVGFHTGPCVADCVGTRNPRYCLFGDSVNIASRMESHSESNRIQCSREAAKILQQQCPSIRLHPRGHIEIKGKGKMQTYWVDEGNFTKSISTVFSMSETDADPIDLSESILTEQDLELESHSQVSECSF